MTTNTDDLNLRSQVPPETCFFGGLAKIEEWNILSAKLAGRDEIKLFITQGGILLFPRIFEFFVTIVKKTINVNYMEDMFQITESLAFITPLSSKQILPILATLGVIYGS